MQDLCPSSLKEQDKRDSVARPHSHRTWAGEHLQRYRHPGAAGLSTEGSRGAAPALPALLQGGATPMGTLQTHLPLSAGHPAALAPRKGKHLKQQTFINN